MKTGAQISNNYLKIPPSLPLLKGGIISSLAKRGKGRFSAHGLSSDSALFNNERGVALMVVMILAVILLGIMASLVYMLVASTQVSGIQKRYKTALDASKGGADVAFEMIATRGLLDISGLTIQMPTNASDCLKAKLNSQTSTWSSKCTSPSLSGQINTADSMSYDLFFTLGTTAQYDVYAKIVDTVNGNSAADLGLQKQGVVSSNTGEVQAVSKPYLYTLEIQAQNRANPAERAQYSILYQY